MEGRQERDPGYDDWFDEPEPPTETQSGAGHAGYDGVEEVWVLPEDDRVRRVAGWEIAIGSRRLTATQVAIIAASALALILAILAAAGVFSGNKAAAPPVTPPPTRPATTASTQTQTATPPVTQAPAQTLSPGATGQQVKILQRALAALGFSPGKPDGDYGPSTQVAVERFQVAHNLAEDGVVGQQTLAALQQALSG